MTPRTSIFQPILKAVMRPVMHGVIGSRSGFSYDPDAAAYITAVQAADGAPLALTTKKAINTFVKGLKADASQVPGLSNWDCLYDIILAVGPASLTGALVPLKTTAATTFTNANFVSGDYSRLTGLAGDGTTKYLASSRLASTLNVADVHLCVDASGMEILASKGFAMTADVASAGAPHLAILESGNQRIGIAAQVYTSNTISPTNAADAMECIVSKSTTDFRYFRNGSQQGATFATARTGLPTGSIDLFCFSYGASTTKTRNNFSAMRLRLYSVGRAVEPLSFYNRWTAYKAAIV